MLSVNLCALQEYTVWDVILPSYRRHVNGIIISCVCMVQLNFSVKSALNASLTNSVLGVFCLCFISLLRFNQSTMVVHNFTSCLLS